jgi:transcriptional regulator with XRE-family HTH domain
MPAMATTDSPLPNAPAGHLVKAARDALLYSQEQLAKASGVSVSTIARMERGSVVSAESLKSVCAVLGLDAVSLKGACADAAPDPTAKGMPPDPGIDAGPAAVRKRGWAGIVHVLRRDLAVCAASIVLCLFVVEGVLQTSAVTFADRRIGRDEMFLSIALLMSAAEVNRAAVLHSAALPSDHPDRSWKPWSRYRPWIWHACGTGSLLRMALVKEADGDGSQCSERSLPQRLSRRDADRTEFVVGPVTRDELVTYAGLLTGDPTIALTAYASPIGDLPPDDATWTDPRSATWAPGPGLGNRLFLHLRVSKAVP